MNVLIFNKKREIKRLYFILPTAYCLLLTAYLLLATVVYADLLDRVVAIVDDEAVMLSDLNEAFQKAENSSIGVTREEVLNSLINRILLLRQAKKFNIALPAGKDIDALINEYIERRLKAFIRIPLDEIELFYIENKESFNGKNFYDVRDEIEEYLIEEKLNKRIIKHIEELKKNAYIVIQLEP
jgi:hypothetical protein